MEEVPIGGSAWVPPPEFAEEKQMTEIELTIDQKLDDASWKVRMDGFTQVLNRLRDDPADNLIFTSACWISKAYAESNISAQAVAMEALACYCNKVSSPIENVAEICSKIVPFLKNAKSKDSCQACMVSLVGKGYASSVLKALESGVHDKLWKISEASAKAIRESISLYGAAVFNFQALVGLIYVLLSHKTRNVREAGMELVAEIYLWKGQLLLDSLDESKLRPGQMSEISELIEKQKDKPKPQVQRSVQQVDAVSVAVSDKPVDLVKLFPKDFAKMNSKNWKERLALLDETMKNMKATEIVVYNAWDVSEGMGFLFDGSNIAVTTKALEVLALIVEKCKDFALEDPNEISLLLFKLFKLNKTSLINALDALLDIWFERLIVRDFTSISKAIHSALDSKVPKIVSDVLKWMSKSLERIEYSGKMPLHTKIVKQIFSLLTHGNGDVRQSALDVLKALYSTSDEDKEFEGCLSNLRDQDVKKAESIMTVVKKPSRSGKMKKDPLEPKIVKDVSENTVKAEVQTLPSHSVESIDEVPLKVSQASPTLIPFPEEFPVEPASVTEEPISSAESTEAEIIPFQIVKSVDFPSLEVAEEAIASLCSKPVLEKLSQSLWKDKLEGLSELLSRLTSASSESVTDMAHPVLAFLHHKYQYKDTNVQVSSIIFKIASVVVDKSSKMSFHLVDPVFVQALGKLGDRKVKESVYDCFMSCCKAFGPMKVIEGAEKHRDAVKNPKALTEWNLWIASVVEQFGPKSVKLSRVIEIGKLGVSHGNKSVRESCLVIFESIGKLGASHLLSSMIEGENSAMQDSIKTKVENAQVMKDRVFVRIRSAMPAQASAAVESVVDTQIQSETLLEVVDISNLLHNSLSKDLHHQKWKIRQSALTDIQQIFNGVKGLTKVTPKFIQLLKEISSRLKADPHKSLKLLYLKVLEDVGAKVSLEEEKCGKYVFANLTDAMGDSKKSIATAAEEALRVWVKRGLYGLYIKFLHKAVSHVTSREGVFRICVDLYQKEFTVTGELVLSVLTCLEDKKSSVRDLSQQFLRKLVTDHGNAVLREEFKRLETSTQLKLRSSGLSDLVDHASESTEHDIASVKLHDEKKVTTEEKMNSQEEIMSEKQAIVEFEKPTVIKKIPAGVKTPILDRRTVSEKKPSSASPSKLQEKRLKQISISFQRGACEFFENSALSLAKQIMPKIDPEISYNMFSSRTDENISVLEGIKEIKGFDHLTDLLSIWVSLLFKREHRLAMKAIQVYESALWELDGLQEDILVSAFVGFLIPHASPDLFEEVDRIYSLMADSRKAKLCSSLLTWIQSDCKIEKKKCFLHFIERHQSTWELKLLYAIAESSEKYLYNNVIDLFKVVHVSNSDILSQVLSNISPTVQSKISSSLGIQKTSEKACTFEAPSTPVENPYLKPFSLPSGSTPMKQVHDLPESLKRPKMDVNYRKRTVEIALHHIALGLPEERDAALRKLAANCADTAKRTEVIEFIEPNSFIATLTSQLESMTTENASDSYIAKSASIVTFLAEEIQWVGEIEGDVLKGLLRQLLRVGCEMDTLSTETRQVIDKALLTLLNNCPRSRSLCVLLELLVDPSTESYPQPILSCIDKIARTISGNFEFQPLLQVLERLLEESWTSRPKIVYFLGKLVKHLEVHHPMELQAALNANGANNFTKTLSFLSSAFGKTSQRDHLDLKGIADQINSHETFGDGINALKQLLGGNSNRKEDIYGKLQQHLSALMFEHVQTFISTNAPVMKKNWLQSQVYDARSIRNNLSLTPYVSSISSSGDSFFSPRSVKVTSQHDPFLDSPATAKHRSMTKQSE